MPARRERKQTPIPPPMASHHPDRWPAPSMHRSPAAALPPHCNPAPSQSAASCSTGSAAGAAWQRAWWDDRFMAVTLDDPLVRVQLFRFIDALPALKDAGSIRRHLAEYLAEAGIASPGG